MQQRQQDMTTVTAATPPPGTKIKKPIIQPVTNSNNNNIVGEPSLIEFVKRTYPAHYALYNTELYFSNMLLTDLSLCNRSFQVVAYVSNS